MTYVRGYNTGLHDGRSAFVKGEAFDGWSWQPSSAILQGYHEGFEDGFQGAELDDCIDEEGNYYREEEERPL